MKILIAYSSATGNTKLLCSGVFDILKDTTDTEIKKLEDVQSCEDYDLIVVGFWVENGMANQEAQTFIQSLKDKALILLGTSGASPESEQADMVRTSVNQLPDKTVNYGGVYLARGQVKTELLERIKQLGLPEKIVDQMHKASIESRPPNEQEINDSVKLIMQFIKTINAEE